MKHKPERMKLSEIVNAMDCRAVEPWYETMGIEIEGLAEAFAAVRAADMAQDYDAANASLDVADEIEAAYLTAHGDDMVDVSWPEHVLTPRFNSDASYQ